MGLSRQLPAGDQYAAGRFFMLHTKQHRHGLEKCSASLLFAFLQLYAMPLGADLAASLGSIAAIGPVLLSLTSAFKYQVWGLFQTVLLLENNYQPPCAWYGSAKLICLQTGGENPCVDESCWIRHIYKPRIYKPPPVMCLPPNPPALPPSGLSPDKRNGVTSSGRRWGKHWGCGRRGGDSRAGVTAGHHGMPVAPPARRHSLRFGVGGNSTSSKKDIPRRALEI